jgi:hypothetical protein
MDIGPFLQKLLTDAQLAERRALDEVERQRRVQQLLHAKISEYREAEEEDIVIVDEHDLGMPTTMPLAALAPANDDFVAEISKAVEKILRG